MEELQRRWRESVTAALLLPADAFRLLQPAWTVASDEQLVAAEALLPRVEPEPVQPCGSLEDAVGEDVCRAWELYLGTFARHPEPADLPELFCEWAMIHAPEATSSGMTALACLAEEAEVAASRSVVVLRQFLATAATFELAMQIGAAPRPARLSISSNPVLPEDDGLTPLGLWRGTDPRRVRDRFATSAIEVRVHLEGSATWTVPRAAGSLVVADGLRATVTSTAIYTLADQTEIALHAENGLWPFYIGRSVAAFDGAGRLRIETVVPRGLPIILGVNVVEVESARRDVAAAARDPA